MEEALRLLRRHWGFADFRPHQRPIVEAVLGGHDVLAVLPTGGGKSLTFQVPALVGRGPTLVITPLVALMEDQVRRLVHQGVPAACLHGQQDGAARRLALHGLTADRWKLFYLSPETLFSPPVWERLTGRPVARIVLDEAHCLVGWGSSFRPSYHRLGAARRALGHPPLCAFTATATPRVQADLIRLLELRTPVRLAVPPTRANLHLAVRWTWSPVERRRRIAHTLAARRGSTGLVYLRTRSGCETLAAELARQGFSVAPYHAGLAPAERRAREADWLAGKLECLCATNAFGMGIDAPHVRWVLHAQLPPTLEEYIQEIGRAGRDGAPAEALMLVSEPTGLIDPTDRTLHTHFRTQQAAVAERASRLAAQLPERGQWSPEQGLDLAVLHARGQLHWEDPFRYRLLRHRPPLAPERTDGLLAAYLWTRRCRWQFLLAAFGWPDQPACGHCDRCCRPVG